MVGITRSGRNQYHRHRRQRRDADNVPRLRLFKGMAHRKSPRTYFMCRSNNFRRVHARVCVDGGGSPPGQNRQ